MTYRTDRPELKRHWRLETPQPRVHPDWLLVAALAMVLGLTVAIQGWTAATRAMEVEAVVMAEEGWE